MFVYEAADLPEKVAGVLVGGLLIVRDEAQAKAIEAVCNGCSFRVVMASELS